MDFQELITVLRNADTKEEMNDRREEMAGVIPDLRPMFDYDQQNRFHQYDLWSHSLETVLGLTAGRDDDILLLAALLHDIGKPETRTVGEYGGKVNMHYFGHAKKGEELLRERIIPFLKENGVTLSDKDVEHLIYYVRHHDDNMEPDGQNLRKELENGVPLSVLENLLSLQIADISAHILLPSLARKLEICRRMQRTMKVHGGNEFRTFLSQEGTTL